MSQPRRVKPRAKPADAGLKLDRVQRWLQTVITNPAGVNAGADSAEALCLIDAGARGLERVVTRSKSMTAAERVAIYANAYYARLFECLGDVYPVLKRALGDDIFHGFALGYLQKQPSRSYTLNELGRHFPRFLRETRPAVADDRDAAVRNWPDFLIDLAALEWTIYEVFDGPGVEREPILTTDDVLDIPPERWPKARLRLVPCLRLLAGRFPVNDYYTAARRAKTKRRLPIPAPRDSFVAITRRDFRVRRYPLSWAQFQLLSALAAGKTVSRAIAAAASDPECNLDTLATDLKIWFRDWTVAGFFQSVR